MNAFTKSPPRRWDAAEAIGSAGVKDNAGAGSGPHLLEINGEYGQRVQQTFYRAVPRNWYTTVVYPFLKHVKDPEQANQIAKIALDVFAPLFADRKPDPPNLATRVFEKAFRNPIGLAAGWDKDADKYVGLVSSGFGFLEVGTVTPKPQPGNERPRVFRLPADSAVINRMGFPSRGLGYARERLARRPTTALIGVNIGANKDSADRVGDYVACATELAPYADYLVCNVSSPNTPGLRNLQGRRELSALVARVKDAISERRVPLLVKIAPDASDEDLDDIVSVGREFEIDGLIVGNTTLARPTKLQSTSRIETGGLSGSPLFALSTSVLRRTAVRVEGKFPLIGCGGVASGEDAYAKIRAGASLVQLYTALVFEGPPLIRRIKDELSALLTRDGFATVADAVGADVR